ncbi:pyrroline-5-carboxylate reductase [Vibrio sp. E150_018]
MEQRKISFIGSGNMARSIFSGMLSSGYKAGNITATGRDEDKLKHLTDCYGIHTTTDNIAAVEQADVVILSVKPQMMADVCADFQSMDLSNKLIISIAAGISAKRLNEMLGQTVQLVRVMPNTPSLIGKGMSGLFSTDNVSEDDKGFAGDLMSAVGEICWVDKESGINNIIAAAGSAPAYFFLFMDAMQQEAMAQGFNKDTARLLIQQAALGAAEMVVANPELDLSTLREQVTSKGGTTAEALKTFNQHNLSDIVSKAMQAAVNRAEEMEKLI